MKKILLLISIFCLNLGFGQITISHGSGVISYGTEITLTAPQSLDTIYYAWDGMNPKQGNFFIGGGTLIVPTPDENNPYWSHFPSMAKDSSQLYEGQETWLVLPDSVDYYLLTSVYKSNVLRIFYNDTEYTYFYIDPITFSRHNNISIVNIAIDYEDGFGGKGILVTGDCTIQDGVCTDIPLYEYSYHQNQLVLPDSIFILDTSNNTYSFFNVVLPDFSIDTFVYYVDQDSIFVSGDDFSVAVLEIIMWEDQGDIYITFNKMNHNPRANCISANITQSQGNCPPNFTIDNDVFNSFPELDQSVIYKPIHFRIDEDDWSYETSATARIAGNYSRHQPAKALRVKVPKENTITQDLFGNGVSNYRTLYLRKWGSTNSYSMINDWLAHSLIENAGIDLGPQSGKPCIVYINGEYWGLYLMQERADDYYVQNHYNVDDDDVRRYQWARWADGGIYPRGAHRDSVNIWTQQVKILEYVDTVDILRPGVIGEINHYLDYKNFFLSRNFCAASNRGDIGNSLIWKSSHDNQIKEIIKDYDFALHWGEWKNTWKDHWHEPDTLHDIYLNNALIQRGLFNKLLENDTLRYWNINTVSDLQTLVMHPDTMSKFITMLTDSILPHLDQNYARWGHLPLTEPDSASYMGNIQNFHTFGAQRYEYINQFFIDDYPEITGITDIQFSMILDDSACFFAPAYNQAWISTVPALDYNEPRWRHSFDIPTPLSASGDFAYWIVNTDTIFESSPWVDIDVNTQYFITAVFTCPATDPLIENMSINEVVSSNQHIVTNHPQGKFEDYIEIYNSGTETVNLRGMYLSDKGDNLVKYTITEDLYVESGEFLLFHADDKPSRGILHTNFKLDKEGESVYLSDGLTIHDSVSWNDEMLNDTALSRCDDEWSFQSPTPNLVNDCEGILLGIDLLSFIAEGKQSHIALTWNMTSSYTTSIYRSTDGNNFQFLEQTSLATYADYDVAGDTWYYYYIVYENDTSPIRSAKVDIVSGIQSPQPNPAKDKIVFPYDYDRIVMYNTLGSQVFETNTGGEQSLPQLPSGIYIVHYLMGNHQSVGTFKIIIHE
jgi:hypothetical protein